MKMYDMNEYRQRKNLELEINRAADGELSLYEMTVLEQKLQQFPDLLDTYRDIMALPDLGEAYPDADNLSAANSARVKRILEFIESEEKSFRNFAEESLIWFRRYALAASIAILAVVSGFYLSYDVSENSEVAMEQLFYPDDQLESESYVLYLEELFDQ